jgi:thiosulfate/3-mercaptopyruvate sulfurtransferase
MKLCPIIEVDELIEIYQNEDVMIFDVSNGKQAKINYEKEHLEGAYFLDLNIHLAAIKDDFSKGGRHPLPEISKFAKTLTELGITKNKHIVIYDDNSGANAGARFWWMLKSIGHPNVQVLNGGLNHAKKKHFPLSSKKEEFKSTSEEYNFIGWELPIIDINEMERIFQNPDYLVVDVRDKERYNGIFEPIDLIAGHIPGAINIPFTENLDQEGLFIKPSELKNKYEAAFNNIQNKNIIVHCGSGVTACHTLLAIAYAGMKIPRLYVGSWSEWSRNNKAIG